MAYKRGKSWRVEIPGTRETKTFKTKAAATAWETERKAEVLAGTRGRPLKHTMADAFERYGREVAPTHRGHRWEMLRIGRWTREEGLSGIRVTDLAPSDLSAWRDATAARVGPASVAREMNLMGSVLASAVEWGWIKVSPARGIKRPRQPNPRRRRISDLEAKKITDALGFDGAVVTKQHQVAVMLLMAIETGMRKGELLSLSTQTVNARTRVCELPLTKNGKPRSVPMSARAVELWGLLPGGFTVSPTVCDTLFRRAVAKTRLEDLHFHDSRGEGLTRLSKKLQPMELAMIAGASIEMIMRVYYRTTAEEIAQRL